MILRVTEEAGVQLVTLQTPGKAFDELIVQPSSDCVGQGSIARGNIIPSVANVRGAKQSMDKRGEFSDRDGNLRSEHERVAMSIEFESTAGRQDEAADRRVVRTIVSA
jgi:hypothetical protein